MSRFPCDRPLPVHAGAEANSQAVFLAEPLSFGADTSIKYVEGTSTRSLRCRKSHLEDDVRASTHFADTDRMWRRNAHQTHSSDCNNTQNCVCYRPFSRVSGGGKFL